MVVTNTTPPSDPIKDFETFLKTYEREPGVFIYNEKISDMHADNSKSLTIFFEDLLDYEASLANHLKSDPIEALEELNESLKRRLKLQAGGSTIVDEEFFVRIATKLKDHLIPLKYLRAKHIDTLVYIKGIIVRASNIRPEIIDAAFECEYCGTIVYMPQNHLTITEPDMCSNTGCKNKTRFHILTDESEFIDYQILTIQENPEELEEGNIPKTVSCILKNDLVGSVNPGARVKIMGIYKSIVQLKARNNKSRLFTTHIEVNHIEGIDSGEDESDMTDSDIKEIETLAKEKGIQQKITRSICTSIRGREDLKFAASLALFGGVRKEKKEGVGLRGNIHVLFIGDPGTGKSQILQNCKDLVQRSIYTSGKGSSAAGLTAAVVMENDNVGMQLEAGALVLASGGIAAIDEFDKMRPNDQSAIHEAMEQGTVSVAKAGIIATLQSQTSIIAAANPKSGRWRDTIAPLENIELTAPIRSRFDLILKVVDEPNELEDDKIASYILNNHMENIISDESSEKKGDSDESNSSDIIQFELLQKYIRYARKLKPKLTPEAAKKIKDFYVEMRNKHKSKDEFGNTIISIVARNLESLIRMSEAYAKMELSDIVKPEHVGPIIEIVNLYLKTIGFDEETGIINMDYIQTGTSSRKKDKIQNVFETIRDLLIEDQAPLEFDDISEPLIAKGITKEFIQEVLVQLEKDGTVYHPKPNTYSLADLPKILKEHKEKKSKK